jgi:hypothetical protein
MRSHDAPPPVLDFARVIAYAILDDSVKWTGKQKIFVGDEQLGPVPRLALAQDVEGELEDILIFHCNDQWEVLGLTGADSIEAAKAIAEHAYHGVTGRWIDTATTVEEARVWIRENHQHLFCLFCGRSPHELKSLLTQKLGAICDRCVEEFYHYLHDPTRTNDG